MTTRPAKAQRTIVLPGATAAEPWELWSAGGAAQCLQTGASPRALAAGVLATLALPAAQIVALPLWLQETREAEFSGMISLQMEAQGLQPRNGSAVFDWSVVAREEKRTLVLVGVLASVLPEEVETSSCASFDSSARCWPLPSNALVFWIEQDRLVMAATRGEKLAYFHALTEGSFTTRVLQDITCIVASLRMQDVIDSPAAALVWSDLPVAGAEKLGAALEVNVRNETRPEPRLPAEPWQLTPARVGQVTRARRVRRGRLRVAGLLVLLGVAVLGVLGARFFLVSRHVAQLQQWQQAHAADLAMVQDTAAAWKDLQPALDTRVYPLELLLHVSEALPSQQVHLTLFDLEGNHLLIRAEATNVTAAFDFFDHLKKSPDLAAYTWSMAQPHLLGNDITQLEVEGTNASAN